MKRKLIVFFLVFMLVFTLPIKASAKTYTTKEEVYNSIKKKSIGT